MIKLKNITLLSLLLIAGTACQKAMDSKSDLNKATEIVQLDQYTKKYKNGVVEVSNLPVDTTRRAKNLVDCYNFESSKMIPIDQVLTDKWDIAFEGRNSLYVYANNSKTDENVPWSNPAGNIMVSYAPVLKNFDEVNEVSKELIFESDNNSAALGVGQDVTYEKYGGSWAYEVVNPEVQKFLYSIPFKNKTMIFKLNNGRYVKFQYINNYNNKPEENSVKSKRGFLSFRYYMPEAGSTDLKTK